MILLIRNTTGPIIVHNLAFLIETLWDTDAEDNLEHHPSEWPARQLTSFQSKKTTRIFGETSPAVNIHEIFFDAEFSLRGGVH